MKLPQFSLTTKIANYFLLLALITVSVVGGVAYFRAREALKQAAFDRLRVAATLKEQEIARWFEDRQRDFLHTTQMPDVQENLAILLDYEDKKAKQNAYQVLSRYLADLSAIKPSMREIFVLDRSNKIVVSTNQEREGKYEILANITYVEEVEAGADFAPIFYVSPLTRKPAITLAKPLPDRSGMVLVDLDLEQIDRIVREKTGLGKTGESYLVGSLISKNVFIAGKFQSVKLDPDDLDSPGINSAMSGMRGYGLYRNYAGNSVLGVYRWLNEQDIALLVEISQAEALNPARELATVIVLVGLISVLGLSVGVNWLSSQLFISRRQLQIKAQEAEAANLAKSAFLANMSHELRTPLNAILGFSQLISRDRAIAATHQESLEIINRSGEHLLNLINDVLEMSKIEAGKITLNNESFDLHRLLDTIQAMFQIKAEAKGLWFKFELADSLPQYIMADSRKLRQLLINLLSNAVKFTQTGGVSLKASCCDSSTSVSDRSLLCFSVVDTGRGIAPEELNTLFDPFVQTASGLQSEGGTGLGLAISRQFVELMEGQIEATSILGKGSTFAFKVSVELIDKPSTAILSATKQVIQLAEGQPQYRLAVVDDRPTNRLALSKLLESVGFEVRTANNGKEAIALWQTWQPDLIWMDMRMPVMDGYAATRQIEQQSQQKATVIIALTASVFAEQREKIIAAGCDDFVAKPFTERVIFEKLQQHLGVRFVETLESEINEHKTAPKPDLPLKKQDLSLLPQDLIIRLNQAAIAVDAEQIQELISHIPLSQQHITRKISKMLDKYDFDGIIELTEMKGDI